MTPANPRKKAFYANSSAQVLFAAAADIALGYLRPATAIALKRLGDAFIRLITMRESAGLLRARVNFGAVHRPGDRQYRAPGQRIQRDLARQPELSSAGFHEVPVLGTLACDAKCKLDGTVNAARLFWKPR